MGTPQCAGAQETPNPEATAADKRLAKKVALFEHQPDDAWVDLKVVCVVRDPAEHKLRGHPMEFRLPAHGDPFPNSC